MLCVGKLAVARSEPGQHADERLLGWKYPSPTQRAKAVTTFASSGQDERRLSARIVLDGLLDQLAAAIRGLPEYQRAVAGKVLRGQAGRE